MSKSVTITMSKDDWQVLKDLFCTVLCEEDFKDKQLERIRQKLVVAIQPTRR